MCWKYDLNEFKVFEVTLTELEERCAIIFPADLKNVDEFAENLRLVPQGLHERKPLTGLDDINWNSSLK